MRLNLSDLAEHQVDGTLTLRLPAAFGSEAGEVESTRVVVTFDRAMAPRPSYGWRIEGGEALATSTVVAPQPWLREWTVGVVK